MNLLYELFVKKVSQKSQCDKNPVLPNFCMIGISIICDLNALKLYGSTKFYFEHIALFLNVFCCLYAL